MPEEVGTEFPRAIGRVARRALAQAGYTRFDQLPSVTREELWEIHGVGPKAVHILEAKLAATGLAFADARTTGAADHSSGGGDGI